MGPRQHVFEVDEEQATLGPEEVAWMRFAVQRLLGSPAPADFLKCAVQRAEEEMPVALSERRGFVSVRDQLLSRCGSFREVRCLDLDAAHPRMQAVERFCVVGCGVPVRRHRLVKGPEGHGEAIDFVDARFDSRVERGDGPLNCGEQLSDPDLKRGDPLPYQSYSSEDVTWQ